MFLAKKIAKSDRLDYIDVIVTRPQDGTNRNDHSMISSTAFVRFNPGGTPVNGGKLLLVTALENPSDAKFEHGVLGYDRTDIDPGQVDQIVAQNAEAIFQHCH